MIDDTVKKETLFLVAIELVLTAIMLAVFLIIGRFSLAVLSGGIFGSAMSILNFFLMCLTVQKAVGSVDEKNRKGIMRVSQSVRSIALLGLLALALGLWKTNVITTLVPLLFPRISVIIRQAMMKKNESEVNVDK